MPKLRLLILDAGVVIHLHELKIWEQVRDQCDIHLSRIVAETEVLFEPGDEERNGEGLYGKDIDLREDMTSGRIRVFDVSLGDLKKFRDQFEPLYFGDLDDGEAESLAFMVNQAEDFLISSGDAIVYRVLGNLGRADQGISLEEILHRIGLGRRMKWPYTKAFRDKYTKEGQADMIRGRGRKM